MTPGRTRLGHAQQEAHDVELHWRLHEHHARRHQSPGHHDARQPAVRAVAPQQHVAGHFEQHVADEEHARAQAVDGFREAQVVQHVELGEGDVHAVHLREQVAHEQEGHQAPGRLAEQLAVGVGRIGCIGKAVAHGRLADGSGTSGIGGAAGDALGGRRGRQGRLQALLEQVDVAGRHRHPVALAVSLARRLGAAGVDAARQAVRGRRPRPARNRARSRRDRRSRATGTDRQCR